MRRIGSGRKLFAISLTAALLCGAGSALLGVCGPFTDISDAAFCPFVLEIFYLGITTGTTPATYDPTATVSRLQMAAFLSRTVDGTLKRGSRRAGLNQYWTPQGGSNLAITTLVNTPHLVVSDGVDVWSANSAGTVSRVRAGDGKFLENWTGAGSNPFGIISAMGRIFVTGTGSPGKLFRIDPSQPAGVVTTVASNLGDDPFGIAFDGSRLWTADSGGSVSIVTPGSGVPFSVTIVASGFESPTGALYDGTNIWVTDRTPGTLLKLDPAGAILQTVTVGAGPQNPVFDGANIWVPNYDGSSVSVVRASNGAVLKTLTGSGLNDPSTASFDGQRILVTNYTGNSVSLWKAADITFLGTISTGANTNPFGACSDGLNFWIAVSAPTGLARF
jgi:hypothetical protein